MKKDRNEYKTDLDSEACYRACLDAGMTDPEKTIPAMVEALRSVVRTEERMRMGTPIDEVREALATLNDESEV